MAKGEEAATGGRGGRWKDGKRLLKQFETSRNKSANDQRESERHLSLKKGHEFLLEQS